MNCNIVSNSINIIKVRSKLNSIVKSKSVLD